MHVVVPAESRPGERRVALVPDVAKRLVAAGWEVTVESGAGTPAWFADDAYQAAGAKVKARPDDLFADADVVVRVQPPTVGEAAELPEEVVHLSFLPPGTATDALAVLAEKRATVFSFDRLPRISRAQSMDALSSQSTVSGYLAALAAARRLDKFFPMLMTAAGTVPPAKVLVMGVGVAGLQAIATARRLGAVVRAYDVRAAAKEEAESLGAAFVDLGVSAEGSGGYARELAPEDLARLQQALVEVIVSSDAVITTAAVPGKRAPILVTRDAVERMAPGAVVIDLAADQGGNCEVTDGDRPVVVSGTTVVGLTNPAAEMPTHASLLYSRNVSSFLALLESGRPDFDDEIVAGSCVLRAGVAP